MDEVLKYESKAIGGLEDGESLLWEGGGTSRARSVFRITNRRAFYFGGKANPAKHRGSVQWPIDHAIVVGLRGRDEKWATIHLGPELWITNPDDWKAVAVHLLNVNRGRLTRARRATHRTRVEALMDKSTQTIHTEHIADPALSADLGLVDGEHILWTDCPIVGQPIRWPVIRKKLQTIAWLSLPSAGAWSVARSRDPLNPLNVVISLVAVIWFLLTVSSLTIKPLKDRYQLRRTRYVLTTRRAFVISPLSGGRSIKFVFVDALAAQFERVMQIDGSGDVTVGRGITFRQIADSSEVHRKLVGAVLAARRDLPDLGWQNV